MSLFARTTFLPSLAYNLLKNRWSTWNWFDRIDDQLVLGALPFHGPVTYHLYHQERIRSVVSMNENFELWFSVTNQQEWQKVFNVNYLQLNTADIFHAPTLQQLIGGVQFIIDEQQKTIETHSKIIHNDQSIRNRQKNIYQENPFWFIRWPIKNNGKILVYQNDDLDFDHNATEQPFSTFVHCKAGRTRSATLVACYLMKKYNLTPTESIQELQRIRKQILLHRKQLEAINNFYDKMNLLEKTTINI